MNTNPKRNYQSHEDHLDLEGLELLLDHAHLEIPQVPVVPVSETKLVQNLLEQLVRVTDLVKDTSERLASAHQRLNQLSTLVTTQAKQMELLDHYQIQAARAASLENQLAAANAELEHHRQPLSRKLLFWVK
ncbi:MAG: hypothetical protein U0103_12175 [Candidatus Obscuribacterales bacterium]